MTRSGRAVEKLLVLTTHEPMALWSFAELAARIGTRRMMLLMNVYPPFVGAGIRVRAESDCCVVVEMKLRGWNKNFIGSHFGGSLYAMCDPFYALILAGELGPEYLVVDKAAAVRFKNLGKGTVRAQFELSREQIAEIRGKADELGRTSPQLTVFVKDETGQVVAEVDKVIYVRKRRGGAWEKAFG
jgi:hypothetical protein